MVDHLIETDFDKLFPAGLDEFPTPENDVNFIDAWLFNTAFASLTEIEEYLITHKDNIEAALGDDILGVNGVLAIDIPAARYPAGKIAMARDTDLIAENIKSGINIFGIDGSLAAGGAGGFSDEVAVTKIEEAPIAINPPEGIISNNMISQTSVTATSP